MRGLERTALSHAAVASSGRPQQDACITGVRIHTACRPTPAPMVRSSMRRQVSSARLQPRAWRPAAGRTNGPPRLVIGRTARKASRTWLHPAVQPGATPAASAMAGTSHRRRRRRPRPQRRHVAAPRSPCGNGRLILRHALRHLGPDSRGHRTGRGACRVNGFGSCMVDLTSGASRKKTSLMGSNLGNRTLSRDG